MRFRTNLIRTAAVAALAVAALLVPAAANAATVPINTTASVCSTVAGVAGPILALVNLGIIDVPTALARIAALTGLPVTEVAACLGL